MSKIPGYTSIQEFERVHRLPVGTGKRHMQRGYCQWPRKTVLDGRSKHPLFILWHSIIDRCINSGHSSGPKYKDRGITISPLWRLDFWRFVQDIEALGPKPDPTYSLDRINNDGNYEPGNVRWATKSEQSYNRRSEPNSTGHAGVYYSERDGLYYTTIKRGRGGCRKSAKTLEEALKLKEESGVW